MRTTLTLDDDLMRRLREEAHRRQLPFREIVNSTLREALYGLPRKKKAATTRTYPSRLRTGFDPAGFNKLVDELEDEALVLGLVKRR